MSKMMLARVLASLAALAILACGSPPAEPTPTPLTQPAAVVNIQSPTPTPTATPTPAPTPTPSATPTPAATPTFAPPSAGILPTVLPDGAAASARTPVGIEREIDRVGYRTEAIRGLPLVGETRRYRISADDLRQLLATQFAEDADEIAITQRLYALLGVIPPDADLERLLTGAFGDLALGLYNADANAIYAVAPNGGGLTPGGERTLAHEFTHALQHAHLGLKALRDDADDNSDRATALNALAEGDAILTDYLYYLNAFDESQQDAADLESAESDLSAYFAAPVFLRRAIAFPYIEGRRFATALFLENRNFSAVDAAYSDPPASTEQIIHPEKYGVDHPAEVSIPLSADALGDGWTVLKRDVMGELFFRSMLESAVGTAARAAEASAGWGGDSYALLESPDGATALASASLWDTPEDASDMAIELRNYLMLTTDASGWDVVESAPAAIAVGNAEAYRLTPDGALSAELRLDPSAKRITLIVAETGEALDAISAAMMTAMTADTAR